MWEKQVSINKENSLLNQKIIYDLTQFTHLDFPDHLACIVWFTSCNMKCEYCYNSSIVFTKSGIISFNEILSFLQQRVGLLDAVVLSGGEATQYDISEFCKEIKKLGFKIKLDTNGINYEHIKSLVESNLVDYIALDYKAPIYKFENITHSNKFELFSDTLDLLISSNITFEVRTTVHNDLLNEDDINFIIDDLKKRGYKNRYFLQEFLDTGDTIGDIGKPIKSFDRSLLSKDIDISFR